MKDKSLVEIAKSYKRLKKDTDKDNQILDLSIAYAKGEVTGTQAAKALKSIGIKYSGGNAVNTLANKFIAAVRQGKIKITDR